MDKLKWCLDSVRNYTFRKIPTYARTVTLTGSTETLSNIPVLVKRSSDTALAGHALSSGADVHFTQNGIELDKELDWYDGATGSGAWWVRIPTLPTSGTSFLMEYGSGDEYADSTGVWDSKYNSVYHFSEATLKQSTSTEVVSATYTSNVTVSFTAGGVTGKQMKAATGGTTNWDNLCTYGPSAGVLLMAYDFSSASTDGICSLYGEHQFTKKSSNVELSGISPKAYFPNSGVVTGTFFSYCRSGVAISNGSVVGTYSGGWTPTYAITVDLRSVNSSRIVDEVRHYASIPSTAYLTYENAQMYNHDTMTTYGAEVRV